VWKTGSHDERRATSRFECHASQFRLLVTFALAVWPPPTCEARAWSRYLSVKTRSGKTRQRAKTSTCISNIFDRKFNTIRPCREGAMCNDEVPTTCPERGHVGYTAEQQQRARDSDSAERVWTRRRTVSYPPGTILIPQAEPR
jgi:hypothetical protein